MKILNSYKARILKQLNISREAWWDDWYDETFDSEYMDHGPVDVWEEPELPKALGIKSPIWTELLTRGDEDMFPYRNIGGNSGVAEYDSGVDWFLIRFKDGSLYLYTHASTFPERIDRMRQLAEAGSGLNAYVNHMYNRHGIQYAGRNYKGRLTLQPGMEAITHHKGIRALLLIEAFQNTLKSKAMKKSISQEGIGDMITSIKNLLTGRDQHGVKSSDKKPGAHLEEKRTYNDEEHAKLKAVADAIKKYYLNDTWIKHQKLVTGKVSGEGISKALNFNGSLGKDPLGNVDKGIKYAEDWARAWIPIVKATDDAVQAADKPTRDAFQKGTGTAEMVTATIAKFNAIPDPIKRFPKPNGCGLGNRAPVVEAVNARGVKDWVTVKVVKPQQEGDLEALNVEQIKTASKLLLRMLDDVIDVPYYVWLDHSDGSKLNDWFDVNSSPYDEYYERFDHHTADDVWTGVMYNLIDDYAVIVALERWIDRSISDTKTVSNEDFQMQVTLEKFDQLQTASGKDGLEPTAQQALKITENLLRPTRVSNEGLWGAVKYLFGGNYEDLPKINAAYDEAVEAVKSTYGNPDWVAKRRLNTGKTIKLKTDAYNAVAVDPRKAFDLAKQTNAKSFESCNTFVKDAVEYLSKFTKVVTSGDEQKIQALLDMFKVTPRTQLESAAEIKFDNVPEIKGLDAAGIHKAAEVFYEAIKYRRATDAIYSQGLYKLVYTEGDKFRYGKDGELTAKLSGPAKELAIKIGESVSNIEDSFYNAFPDAWDNIDIVIRGTLSAMEASAD